MAGFVSFFPQLVAGPLQRSWHLVPQIVREPRFDWLNVRVGVNLILWGIAKKVILADTMGTDADAVFASPQAYSSLGMLLGVYAFAFQIYSDFSAYSDIAMGSANPRDRLHQELRSALSRRGHQRLLAPMAHHAVDLASRLPLHPARRVAARRAANVSQLVITMVIGGVWHGASWTFVVWGAFHGELLAITRFVKDHAIGRSTRGAWMRPLRIALTFNLVCIGWVLFRSPTLASAGVVLRKIALWDGAHLTPDLGILALLLLGAYAGHVLTGRFRSRWPEVLGHATLRWDVAYTSALLLLLVLAATSGVTKFIYFEF